MQREKNLEIAGGLNFFIPGAGFAYLGQWGWAVLNFVVFVLLVFVLGAVTKYPIAVWFVAALFSGSIAGNAAKKHNEQLMAGVIARVEANAAISATDVMDQHRETPAPPPRPAPPPLKAASQPPGASALPAHASAPPPPPPTSARLAATPVTSGTSHRFCSQCGAPAEGANFCPQCGAQLRGHQPTPQ
jgi:hypothetical protein